jgi:isoleucyl-tRNA synthetase
MEIGIGVDFNPTDNDKIVIEELTTIYEEWLNHPTNDKFHFVDGPPFVSSDNLHFGHILISFMKSTTLYFQRMNGKCVLNKKGFDVHGLPIEMVVNKLLGVHTRKEVLTLGIDKYNQFCKETILKYSDAWKPIFDSIGRMTSSDHYKTMDTPFMETCWWAFKQLWEKGLIYKGIRVMPYSPACNTPLSNFEAGENYKTIDEMSIYVGFRLLDDIPTVDYDNLPYITDINGNISRDIYIVVWTTTPWTLPANMALCVNRDADYVIILVKKLNKLLLIAKNSVSKLFPDYSFENTEYNILDIIKGNILVKIEYEPLYMYNETIDNTFHIFEDDFVQCYPYEKDKSPGSGVVHLAPGFGEDDFRVCQFNGLKDPFVPLDENGYYTLNNDCDGLQLNGCFYRDCNRVIINNLEDRGLIIKKEQYSHEYPFCWRTDTPLIYKAMDAWFIEVTKIRQQMLENNKKINWFPAHIGEGRFRNWLENTKDWCVSRNRYFGTPIPIWQTDDGDTIVVGSIAELAELAGVDSITDLHIEFVDKLVIVKNGKTYKRIDAVFDCWFESGCVPYGQIHYPFAPETIGIFDNKETLSDFICEGIDQTRGWFYTLHVLSTALFDKPAFKNVVCAGIILAAEGRKMSKRLGNFVDTKQTIQKYGGDILRLYMLNLPATRAEPSRFKEEDIKTNTKTIQQWINSIKFLVEHIRMYECVVGTKFSFQNEPSFHNDFDIWIISRLNTSIERVRDYMTRYEFMKYVAEVFDFIEDYTNWYLKFNRSRLKGKETPDEWISSLNTCIYIVNHFNLVIAPLTPFLSHTISKNLQNFGISYFSKKSVLLENFPSVRQSLVNEQGERRFKLFQQVAEIIRSMRSQNGLGSVKQPIKLVRVYLDNPEDLETIRDYFSSDEMNILNITISNQIKPEYYITLDPCHGKVYRGDYPKIKAAVSKLSINDIKNIEYLDIEGHHIPTEQLTINKKSVIEVSSNESILEKDGICVILDKTQDEEVKMRHFIRIIIYNTQRIRKNAGIRPWNKISFMYSTSNNKLYNWLLLNKTELENSLGYPVTELFKKESPKWSDDLLEYEEDAIRLVIYKLD